MKISSQILPEECKIGPVALVGARVLDFAGTRALDLALELLIESSTLQDLCSSYW